MLLTIESNFRYDIIFLGRVIKSKILCQPVDGNFTLYFVKVATLVNLPLAISHRDRNKVTRTKI